MPDFIAEIRRAIVQAAMQAVNREAPQRSWDNRSQVLTPTNPEGASSDLTDAFTFATGYDSGTGLTVVPFMFDESTLGGGDTLI